MRKVVIIANSDPRCQIVGGVGTYAAQLARELSADFDVLYIGKKQKDEPSGESPYEVVIANKKPGKSNINFLKGLFGISLDTNDDSIIHAQRPDWLWAFRNQPGKKVVTLHGSHAKNMLVKKGWLLRSLYSLLEKKGLRIADVIIAVDHATAEEYEEKYSFVADKIVVQPVGVNTTLFSAGNKRAIRKELGIPVAKKTFLYVGRLSKEKNIDEMIKQIRSDELLIIVGKGEEEAHLVDLCEKKDVRFAGPKRQEELQSYYAAADALLLFSSHEGLPTVVLEGFACGLPVVATPVGELPRIVVQGKNGFLIKKNNHRRMMTDVLKKNEIMRRECRKTALKYDWKKVARKLVKEVYKE